MTFFLFFCKKMHFLVRYSNNIFLSIWKLILTLRNTVFFYDLIAGPPTFLWKYVFDLHFPFNTKGSRTVCPKRAFYALNHTLLYPFVRYSRYGLGLSKDLIWWHYESKDTAPSSSASWQNASHFLLSKRNHQNNNPQRIKNEGFFGTVMTVLSDNSSHLIVAPLTTVKTNFVKM